MPKVVHCRRTPEAYVYVGRPSIFGNPFPLNRESERDTCIEQFTLYFEHRLATDPEFLKQVLALAGQDLGCWCAPRRCHADVILHYANVPVQ